MLTIPSQTGSDIWRKRVEGIISGLDVFFYNGTDVMFEVACERNGKCDVDQRSFKAYLSRWMGTTMKVAPWTEPMLSKRLRVSAQAAAKQCTGGSDGKQCGMRWYTDFDGSMGVGEQMTALEVIQSNLYKTKGGPFSIDSGGTSKSDPNAGGNKPLDIFYRTLSTADKAGAAIVTTIMLLALLGGAWWMVS